jgi:hypothetical protein
MGIDLNTYKKKIINIIKETIIENESLNELFETPPFKINFDFKENSDEIYIDNFNDPKNNIIKIYFYKGPYDIYMLDFTMNGQSGKDIDINYSLKEYTSLLGTIAKATSQFLDVYKPNALQIDGEDTLNKQLKGKKGQKSLIYNYFANKLEINPNYKVTDRKSDGSFNLSKKV